jgi:hypothetical protein
MSYLSKFFSYWGIQFDDKLLGQHTPALVQNKIFDSSNSFENVPKYLQFFNAGSNSTGNVLRYLTLGASVATASGESEDNVNIVFDHILNIKRIKYIIGINTKNGISNISFRKNNADVVGTTLAINPAQVLTFDSGAIDIEILATDKICWKWDTTLSTTGTITIIYHAEVEIS